LFPSHLDSFCRLPALHCAQLNVVGELQAMIQDWIALYDPTTEQLWSTLYTLGADDGQPLDPKAVERLMELGIAEVGPDAKPQLTAYGERCFAVMESGDGEVPELAYEEPAK
jgi:hypothetical protein